jgi:hypothetical protein
VCCRRTSFWGRSTNFYPSSFNIAAGEKSQLEDSKTDQDDDYDGFFDHFVLLIGFSIFVKQDLASYVLSNDETCPLFFKRDRKIICPISRANPFLPSLPDEAFDKFPQYHAAEIHLATGFQNIIYDSEFFPPHTTPER